MSPLIIHLDVFTSTAISQPQQYSHLAHSTIIVVSSILQSTQQTRRERGRGFGDDGAKVGPQHFSFILRTQSAVLSQQTGVVGGLSLNIVVVAGSGKEVGSC